MTHQQAAAICFAQPLCPVDGVGCTPRSYMSGSGPRIIKELAPSSITPESGASCVDKTHSCSDYGDYSCNSDSCKGHASNSVTYAMLFNILCDLI